MNGSWKYSRKLKNLSLWHFSIRKKFTDIQKKCQTFPELEIQLFRPHTLNSCAESSTIIAVILLINMYVINICLLLIFCLRIQIFSSRFSDLIRINNQLNLCFRCYTWIQFTTVCHSVSNLPPDYNVSIYSRRIMESVLPTLTPNIFYKMCVYGSPLRICKLQYFIWNFCFDAIYLIFLIIKSANNKLRPIRRILSLALLNLDAETRKI